MDASARPIRSRENPHVKRLLRLATSSRARQDTGMTLLDGVHLVEAFVESGRSADVLAVSESAYSEPALRALYRATPAQTRIVLADKLIERISQVVTSTGVIATVRTPIPFPLAETLGGCVMIDGVQDPGNLGSILRSAVASGIEHLVLAPGSVDVWAPKVVRAGQGAHFFINIHQNAAFGGLKFDARTKLVATAPDARLSLFEADLRGEIAWIFGNEGAGISAQARALAPECVKIPMLGRVESLNVAAAAAICLFEQVRQNLVRS